jgi:uncharacterized protein YjiS (DUF1127 family)
MFWLAEVFNGRYSEQEMRRYEEWARQQRAATVARMFTGCGRTIKKALLVLRERIRHERRRRAAIRELNSLSDRALKDIGLVRAEIRSVVTDLLGGRRTGRALEQSLRMSRRPLASQRSDDEAASEWRRAA